MIEIFIELKQYVFDCTCAAGSAPPVFFEDSISSLELRLPSRRAKKLVCSDDEFPEDLPGSRRQRLLGRLFVVIYPSRHRSRRQLLTHVRLAF